MKHFLTKLGLWIARWGYWPSDTILNHARVLCDDWEPRSDVSGEHKRHQVYARLIKDFPTAHKRTLGLAIELVLNT